MTIHELKTWQPHYGEVEAGAKTFEVRKADRDFKVGDYLRLCEYRTDGVGFTGNRCTRVIKHLLRGGQFGIEDGYVVLSLDYA